MTCEPSPKQAIVLYDERRLGVTTMKEFDEEDDDQYEDDDDQDDVGDEQYASSLGTCERGHSPCY